MMRPIDFFDRGVSLNPHRHCLVGGGKVISYQEAQAASHRIARELARLGIGPGCQAAILSDNDPQAFLALLGILRAGGAWVPANARSPIGETSYIIDLLEVRLLFYQSRYEGMACELASACPALVTMVALDSDLVPESVDLWLAKGACAPVDVPADRTGIALLMPSGGTTGRPKGIVWTNLTFETLVASWYLAMPRRKAPVNLVAAPMTHAAGVIALIAMAEGATNVILPGFDAELILNSIETFGVTHLFLPPTAIYRLLDHPAVAERDYSSLEHLLYAAAPMAVDRIEQAIGIFGPVMTSAYGQSEAPMFCTFFPPSAYVGLSGEERQQRLLSCGKPGLLTTLAVMDDAGGLLEPGHRGEIVVRSNLVMQEYFKNPEASAAAIRNSWLATGDIGYRDKDGWIYLVDRKRDMIISGGFNIFPSVVEQAIWSHPAVADCAVIGVPDSQWGEAVKAVVQLREDLLVTESEIIVWCKQRLGSVQAPKSVEFWPDLPRSAAGKVLKREIRDRFWGADIRRI